MNLNLRPESPADHAAIRRVHERAFGRHYEADIPARLRESDAYLPELPIVAEVGGEVVGHVILSKARVEGAAGSWSALVLGPIGVLPECQQQGVGSALMRAALELAEAMGYGAVILIGHPTYYPRFGFVPASRFGLKTTYDVPDDVFMARLLRPDRLEGISGMVLFPEAFQE